MSNYLFFYISGCLSTHLLWLIYHHYAICEQKEIRDKLLCLKQKRIDILEQKLKNEVT